MQHAPALSTLPGESLSSHAMAGLTAIAGDLEQRFLPVGEAMLALVGTVDSVVKGLAEVRAAFAGQSAASAIGELDGATACLLATPELHARRRDCFVEVRARVLTLQTLSADLDRVLRVLEFYSLNIKIAAAGAGEFVDFADEMRNQLSQGRRELPEFRGAIGRLCRQLDGMQAIDRQLAAECARLVPQVPEQLASAARSLDGQRQRIGAVASAGEGAAAGIRSRIADALGAIQIGDNARQRIEHVVFACELLAGIDAGEGGAMAEAHGHLAALCVAQLEAIVTDFGSEAQRLLGSVETLQPETRRLFESTRNERSVTESAELIARLEAGVEQSVALTAHLQRADADVAAILALVLGTIADLSTRVERVRDLGIEVGYMSVNANLRCRHHQAISQPVAVIAREIKSHSRLIDDVSGEFVVVAEALTELAARIGESGAAQSFDVGAALARSLAALRDASLEAEAGIGKVLVDCDGITDRLDVIAGQLRSSIAVAATLDAVRRDLEVVARPLDPAALAAPGHPVTPLLERVAAVYTMAQERAIHRTFAPHACSETAPPPPPADDDDDALFEDALF